MEPEEPELSAPGARASLRVQMERAKGRLRGRGMRWRADRRLSATARSVRREHLTYLSIDRLETLEREARRLNRRRVPGDFVECGVALGGSAIVLAAAMGPGRSLHAFDVFGMIPAPGEDDPPDVHERYRTIKSGQSAGIGGDVYYGYRDDLLEHVTEALARYGHPVGDHVSLHRGLFEETLDVRAPVALAHIDCDWHDAVALCLQRIGEHLSPGGVMVLDDYDDFGGAATAANAYLCEHAEMELVHYPTNAGIRRDG